MPALAVAAAFVAGVIGTIAVAGAIWLVWRRSDHHHYAPAYLDTLVRKLPFGVLVAELIFEEIGHSPIYYLSDGARENMMAISQKYDGSKVSTLGDMWAAIGVSGAEHAAKYIESVSSNRRVVSPIAFAGRRWISHILPLGGRMFAAVYIDVTELSDANEQLKNINRDLLHTAALEALRRNSKPHTTIDSPAEAEVALTAALLNFDSKLWED